MTNDLVKPHCFFLWSLWQFPDSFLWPFTAFPPIQRYPSQPPCHPSPRSSIHRMSCVLWTAWFIRKRRVLGGRPVWVWILDYISSHVHLVTSSCLWKPQPPYLYNEANKMPVWTCARALWSPCRWRVNTSEHQSRADPFPAFLVSEMQTPLIFSASFQPHGSDPIIL